jgi:hypothetical protein
MSMDDGPRTYPLVGFAAAAVSRQPLPVREITMPSVFSVLLRGLDCAIYGGAAVVGITFGAWLMIALPMAWAWGLLAIAVALVSGALVAFRTVHVYQALRNGQAFEADIISSSVGPARLTGTPWGDLVNGRAVRGAYRIHGVDAIAEYYLQERWATSLQPGMKIWVITVNGRPALLAPKG